jgi:cardiolipin synthase
VRVRILTPAINNKPHLALHIVHEARRHDFELLRYPGVMSHMKAMLVDDETLVAGSGNFDPVSYYLMDEYLFLTKHPDFVDAFRTRAWEPAAARAEPFVPRVTMATRAADAVVRLGSVLFATLAPPGREP